MQTSFAVQDMQMRVVAPWVFARIQKEDKLEVADSFNLESNIEIIKASTQAEGGRGNSNIY